MAELLLVAFSGALKLAKQTENDIPSMLEFNIQDQAYRMQNAKGASWCQIRHKVREYKNMFGDVRSLCEELHRWLLADWRGNAIRKGRTRDSQTTSSNKAVLDLDSSSDDAPVTLKQMKALLSDFK
eukprot:3350968-Karenia_brevis.AAC.1